MSCEDKNIKELLVAYLNEKLDHQDHQRVETHLASCDDCRDELFLLGTISEESVPDPGERFWAEMPDRIYGDIREYGEKKQSRRFDLRDFFIPRWALAAAGAIVMATATWFLFNPGQVKMADVPENRAAWFEDTTDGGNADISELSPTEIDAVVQWVRNEFTPIARQMDPGRTDDEPELSEELYELSPEELDRVYKMLKAEEREFQNRQKETNEKRLG